MIQEKPMGIVGSPGAERPPAPGRSVRSTFAITVAVPAGVLVLAWGLALAAAFNGSAGNFSWPSHESLARLLLPLGGGIVAVTGCLALAAAFAARIQRDLTGLEAAARQLADEQLPRAVEGIRR